MTRANPAPERTRRTRTPEDRAVEALAVVDRQIAAVNKRVSVKRQELEDTIKELAPLMKRREYLAANPDLPSPEKPASDTPAGTGG